MKQYRLTWIGLGISILVGVLSYLIDLDPFDRLVDFFASVEKYELDEIFIGVVIFLAFLAADLLIQQRKEKVEREKSRIYRAMITSSHHILNNFLNQMQLFKMTAESTPGFDPEVLELYNRIIDDASQQIDALSSLTEISEEAIRKSVMPGSDHGGCQPS
ncbi:MAG: hypothetical protein GXO34_03495 [Deltaproteobacteria bacterium]|nr:hypothetical protein [Deltaproteobacteria bacterium]